MPHFAINNDLLALKCLREKLPVCGYRLDKVIWFVGGPRSAFHGFGRYLDPPMREECATYALQVCPYLAAPNYSGRVDAAGLDPTKLPKESWERISRRALRGRETARPRKDQGIARPGLSYHLPDTG